MGLYELNIAREKLSAMQAGTCLGLENRDSLNFMAVGFSNLVSDIAAKFIDSGLIAPFVGDNSVSVAMKKLDAVPYTTLDKFTIHTPEGVIGAMVPYLEVLQEASRELATLQVRLLAPLKQWTGKAISNPGFVEKVWLDKNLEFINVDSHIESLAKHYNDKVGDDISFAPIINVYPRAADFKTAGDIIQELSKTSALIMGQNIPKQTEEIAAYVKRLIDANDRSDYMEKAPAATISKLSESLYHAGREVEFLSIVLFQIRMACVAYEESVKKITDSL